MTSETLTLAEVHERLGLAELGLPPNTRFLTTTMICGVLKMTYANVQALLRQDIIRKQVRPGNRLVASVYAVYDYVIDPPVGVEFDDE